MKKLMLAAGLVLGAMTFANAQEYKVITTVESIVPGGIGRSRIIAHTEAQDYKAFTTERTGDKDDERNKTKRKDAKVDGLEETKLLNFYSMVGINFQNIASNDALISSKITTMVAEGWTLEFVTSGVESDGGDKDGKGIFITRYIFKR
jgi:hypothetical protein